MCGAITTAPISNASETPSTSQGGSRFTSSSLESKVADKHEKYFAELGQDSEIDADIAALERHPDDLIDGGDAASELLGDDSGDLVISADTTAEGSDKVKLGGSTASGSKGGAPSSPAEVGGSDA